MALKLNFFGICTNVESSNLNIIENIRKDFSHFVCDKDNQIATHVNIEIFQETPPYNIIKKDAKKTFHTKDTINYDSGNLRFSDHHGKALTIYDFSKEKGQIYSQDESILHERTYLLILSRVGNLLDRKGIHRVHALGISINNKAILCLLPMKGGKTTLCLELLKEKDIKLISDETPLMNSNYEILSFPSRLGVLDDINLDVPHKYLRRFNRSQFAPKTLIDIEFFQGKISDTSVPYIVLIGKRDSSRNTQLQQITKLRTALPFWINSVIGRELPHTASYFMRFNLKDILAYIKIALSRFIVCSKIVFKSKTYRFRLGTNPRANAKFLAEFLRKDLRQQEFLNLKKT